MMNRGVIPLVVALSVLALNRSAAAYHVEPLMVNGPDSEKIVISVIGDGYDIFSQEEFIQAVNALVMQGVFPFDETYRNNSTAFNVYRIDAVSADYGVTIRTTYTDPVTGNPVNSQPGDPYYDQDTVLDYIQTGIWGNCWMLEGPGTVSAITQINGSHLSRQPDYTLTILNVVPFTLPNGVTISPTFGGCARGSRLSVTQSAGWSVVAHEWGHGVGGLLDEYVASGQANLPHPGPPITGVTNCSTILNKNTVSWSSLISTDPRLTIPTVFDGSWMDSNKTVGEFSGCHYYGLNVYRPANTCRMNGNWPGFCPVCEGIFEQRVSTFIDQPADYFDLTNYLGARCKGTSVPLNYTDNGSASNGTTSSAAVQCGGWRVQNAGVFSNRVVGRVTVVDRNPSSDACCTLIARQPSGVQVAGVQVCSKGSGAAPQTLSLVYPKLIMASADAYLNIECSIPPIAGGLASSVFDYQLGQQVF